MIGEHIGAILLVTGVITGLPVLQYFFPRTVLRLLSQMEITDEKGLFFARHWGLCSFTIGALLCYAAYAPAPRPIIVGAILIEKLGLAALVALNWNQPFARGLRLSGVFDALCSALYGVYLLGLA